MNLAVRLAEAALDTGESHETLYCLAAFGRQQSGDNHGAASLYLQAAELAPGNPSILAGAGDALRCAGRLRDAVRLFDQAIALDPSSLAAWYGRAMALEADSALDDAMADYRRVTELAPQSAAGFSALASIQVRTGDLDAARANGQIALALGPNETGTLQTQARIAFASGDSEAAATWAETLLASPAVRAEDEIIAATLLGDCRDRLGQSALAYQAYQRANARFSALHEGAEPGCRARQSVEAIGSALANLEPSRFSGRGGPVPLEATSHVFLLGFPRSGTTLTEQILSTLPNMVSLEEAPTLVHLNHYLEAGRLDELLSLSDRQIDALRAEYWAKVAEAGAEVTGKTFIDMDPLKGAALPAIARLFPDAKVIVMHRDPRDVVWSCFRHSFVYSPATCEFTSLERAARHYDAVTTVLRLCLTRLKIDAHILCYERLVREFEVATRDLCTFLDVRWSAEMAEFDRAAQGRRVRTASADQVRQALFDGSGQWNGYATFMDHVLPILAPWIDPSSLLEPVPTPAE